MPKISRNSLDKFNKSCSTIHQESSKIEFAFVRFFYDFLESLHESAKWLYYWRCTFQHRPLEIFKVSRIYPSLAPRPWGKSQSSYICPLATGWARRRRWPAGLGQQAARDPQGVHLEAIGGVGRRGGGSGEGAWRWPAVAAAVGCGSDEGVAMPGNGRQRKSL
jgi:hypothetical protein